jgi:DNA-binding protein Fis
MGKKKKNQTQGPTEAPVNQNVFSEGAAAQGAAATTVSQTNATNAAQVQSQIPPDVAELIRSSLRVIVAQRKTSGLAITLTALTKAVKKGLENYLRRVPGSVVREFIRNELASMGYPIFVATIESGGELFQAEVVMLFKNYDEIVEMIKAGRMNTLLRALSSSEVDPLYDKMLSKARAHA